MEQPHIDHMAFANRWGHHINFFNSRRDDEGRYRVYGHMTPIPESGFRFACPDRDNIHTVILSLEVVEPQSNPGDMFFAWARLVERWFVIARLNGKPTEWHPRSLDDDEVRGSMTK